MNLQQLEYILAVDELRHFAKAAEYCNVEEFYKLKYCSTVVYMVPRA